MNTNDGEGNATGEATHEQGKRKAMGTKKCEGQGCKDPKATQGERKSGKGREGRNDNNSETWKKPKRKPRKKKRGTKI